MAQASPCSGTAQRANTAQVYDQICNLSSVSITRGAFQDGGRSGDCKSLQRLQSPPAWTTPRN